MLVSVRRDGGWVHPVGWLADGRLLALVRSCQRAGDPRGSHDRRVAGSPGTYEHISGVKRDGSAMLVLTRDGGAASVSLAGGQVTPLIPAGGREGARRERRVVALRAPRPGSPSRVSYARHADPADLAQPSGIRGRLDTRLDTTAPSSARHSACTRRFALNTTRPRCRSRLLAAVAVQEATRMSATGPLQRSCEATSRRASPARRRSANARTVSSQRRKSRSS